MNDLVRHLLRGDCLQARLWIQAAHRKKLRWDRVPRPARLRPVGLAVAAGIVEMMAERTGVKPPEWTAAIGPAPEPRFICCPTHMPRTRLMAEQLGPPALRRRKLYALPGFLTFA